MLTMSGEKLHVYATWLPRKFEQYVIQENLSFQCQRFQFSPTDALTSCDRFWSWSVEAGIDPLKCVET